MGWQRGGRDESVSPGSLGKALDVFERARRDLAVDLSKELLELRTVSRRVRSSSPLATANTLPPEIEKEPSAF
jgi:hypothetical protein